MYETSLTQLGNFSGYYNDNNSLYGAEFNEIQAVTPYYERVVHHLDQKPWKNQSFDKTYMNYSKMMNEPPVVTYKELELKPISLDNYEFVENFENNMKINLQNCTGGCTQNNSNGNNTIIKETMTLDNSNQSIQPTMENYYPKLLSFIFILFIIYQIM